MSDAPRNRLADRLAWLCVAGAQRFVQLLPLRWAQRLGAAAGRCVGALDRRHLRRAEDQIRLSFPEWDETAVRRCARDHYAHLGMLGAEILWMPRMTGMANWRDYIHCDLSVLDELKTRYGGGILAVGHIGNWEIGAYAPTAVGHPLHSIARPLKNPYLDRLLVRTREFLQQKIIAKEGALLGIRRAMDKGFVAMVIDQNVRHDGIFVDFFGRKASTIASVAKIALKSGKPILVFSNQRRPDGRFEIFLDETIHVEDVVGAVGRDDAPREITQRFTSALERAIRRYPAQWLWTHQRWKTQPEE